MTLIFQTRHLVRSSAHFQFPYLPDSPLTELPARTASRLLQPNVQRPFSNTPFLAAKKKEIDVEALRKLADASKQETAAAPDPEQAPKRGSLASSSIFSTAKQTSAYERGSKNLNIAVPKESQATRDIKERRPELAARAVIPQPETRARWLRKMVIRSVRRRGRLSSEEVLLRTERSSTSASHLFKTSMKKLNPLARQIAGKNIDDAILQMRFSKKKAAMDVKEHLEAAKNEAIVKRGMGLGAVENEDVTEAKPVKIQLKDKKWKTITDPTQMYIDQAWVSKGPYGRGMDHRARGQIYMLKPPHTGITVVLKEEKTRIREYEERKAKQLRQRTEKMWTQLKDRKITAQRQWYSW